MKLGVYIHLGTLLNDKLLTWATELRQRGVSHCCYANAQVDTVAVAKGDTAAMQAWAAKVGEQLAALSALGMTVGVRPMPMILEQIEVLGDSTAPLIKTPNFTARNTSLESARLLIPVLGSHNIIVQHECHDTSNGDIRRWATRYLGSATTFYYGFNGPWNKYGTDFPEHDLPHTVHVALNAAGAGDVSAPAAVPGPAACTPRDIRLAADAFNERMPKWTPANWIRHVQINVLTTTPPATIERMVYAAAVGCRPDILMLRSVFGANDPRGPEGNTLTDPANEKKHWVTSNVLQAIEECVKWMA